MSKYKRAVVRLLTLLLAAWLCISCGACARAGRGDGYVSRTFLMMDTVIEIKLRCDTETAQPILERCGEIMTSVEQALSRTFPDSLVSIFNRTGQVDLGEEFSALMSLALEISAKTEGAFDPTVEGLVTLWNRCGEENRLPTDEELAESLSRVGYDRLTLLDSTLSTRTDPRATVDLGAIGKGYAIERVIAYLETTDVPGGVVSFGGNIAVFGSKEGGEPYRIGLRDPQNTAGVLGYLTMPTGVISVSGDYERYVTVDGVRYHHILDPKTGYPVDNGLHSVAVICEDGVLADALSTALFVMGREQALAFYRAGIYEFEAILVTDDEIILTDGLASSENFELAATGYTVTEEKAPRVS